MYIRAVHAERNLLRLHQFIRSNPLGLFTTAIPHPTIPTLQTTHIPWVLYDEGENGVLRGHMARANPQTKSMIASVSQPLASSLTPTPEVTNILSEEVLILFNAPVHSYVPPQFYVESKPADGKVVPTWNFAAVQVYGKCKIFYDNSPTTSTYLQRVITDLSNQEEEALVADPAIKKDHAWKVSDAPVKYVEALKRGIIGLEVEIERVEGRFKLSQENGPADWQGVVDGFQCLGSREGEVMAAMIEERGEITRADKEEAAKKKADE